MTFSVITVKYSEKKHTKSSNGKITTVILPVVYLIGQGKDIQNLANGHFNSIIRFVVFQSQFGTKPFSQA